MLALLPLLARGLAGGDAGTFTLLLASMGAGAIVAVLVLPRLRQAHGRDDLVVGGAVVQSGATAVMAFAPSAWIAVPAMVAGGMAWITVANSLAVSAQMSLPNWVRARAMASYQMAIMGASALGAALWGQVATVGTIQTALPVGGRWRSPVHADGRPLRHRQRRRGGRHEPGTRRLGGPARRGAPQAGGRVITTVEYLIDPCAPRRSCG